MDWVKLLTEFDGHPKVLGVGIAGAGLYARSLAYCGRYETDGQLPREWAEQAVAREGLTDLPERLVAAGLWREDESGYEITDFTQINRSRDEMDQIRSKRASAGQAGGKAKAKQGAKQKRSKSPSYSYSSSNSPPSSRSQNGKGPSTVVARANEAGFTEWLTDHATVTSRTPPGEDTKAYAALAGRYAACAEEGYGLAELKLASRGAHANDWRREQGYDKADSVLRITKVHDLIVDGRRADSGARGESKASRRAREILASPTTIDGSAEEVTG